MPGDLSQFVDHYLSVLNSHDMDGIIDCYSTDYVGMDVAEATNQSGREGVFDSFRRYFQAFPDITFETEEMIVQENRVALFWKAQGTHHGPLMNIPPTGRKIAVRGVTFLTVRDQAICKSIVIWDVAGLLRSINLLPEL